MNKPNPDLPAGQPVSPPQDHDEEDNDDDDDDQLAAREEQELQEAIARSKASAEQDAARVAGGMGFGAGNGPVVQNQVAMRQAPAMRKYTMRKRKYTKRAPPPPVQAPAAKPMKKKYRKSMKCKKKPVIYL
jgi:hypothetical protein